MQIVMAGASGFLGTHLAREFVAHGHTVVRLVRRDPVGPDESRWDPRTGRLDPGVLDTADAVVNLAGATVAKRWTGQYRQTIRTSRTTTTSTIARAAAEHAAGRPADRGLVMINASAIGYYGDTGDRAVDESAPSGQGFLAEVCQAWEAATGPAEQAGVRVVRLRTGLPLAPSGGLLLPLLPLFRLGLGGRLGTGRQYWPWISLADWLSAVRFLLGRPDLAGPVNLVGPDPVTNAEFAAALGRVLHRPAVLPAPAAALRLALGGFAVEVLGSRRVLPGVLSAAGFEFQHRDVVTALRSALLTGPAGTAGSATR